MGNTGYIIFRWDRCEVQQHRDSCCLLHGRDCRERAQGKCKRPQLARHLIDTGSHRQPGTWTWSQEEPPLHASPGSQHLEQRVILRKEVHGAPRDLHAGRCVKTTYRSLGRKASRPDKIRQKQENLWSLREGTGPTVVSAAGQAGLFWGNGKRTHTPLLTHGPGREKACHSQEPLNLGDLLSDITVHAIY